MPLAVPTSLSPQSPNKVAPAPPRLAFLASGKVPPTAPPRFDESPPPCWSTASSPLSFGSAPLGQLDLPLGHTSRPQHVLAYSRLSLEQNERLLAALPQLLQLQQLLHLWVLLPQLSVGHLELIQLSLQRV